MKRGGSGGGGNTGMTTGCATGSGNCAQAHNRHDSIAASPIGARRDKAVSSRAIFSNGPPRDRARRRSEGKSHATRMQWHRSCSFGGITARTGCRLQPPSLFTRIVARLLLSALTACCAHVALAGDRRASADSPPAALYHNYCSVCHGDQGDGQSRARGSLNPPPRDFTTAYALSELSRERMVA